jgi:hypothetical protein
MAYFCIEEYGPAITTLFYNFPLTIFFFSFVFIPLSKNAILFSAESPTACPGGTYQSETGQVECLSCMAGYYCESGAIMPVICPVNHYCPGAGIYQILLFQYEC